MHVYKISNWVLWLWPNWFCVEAGLTCCRPWSSVTLRSYNYFDQGQDLRITHFRSHFVGLAIVSICDNNLLIKLLGCQNSTTFLKRDKARQETKQSDNKRGFKLFGRECQGSHCKHPKSLQHVTSHPSYIHMPKSLKYYFLIPEQNVS